MKRVSSLNTWIGAISGSLTPYLGWAAAGGDLTSLMPFFLSSYMFAWQFSHFYGILWTYKDDYENAGFKMINDHKVAASHIKFCILI